MTTDTQHDRALAVLAGRPGHVIRDGEAVLIPATQIRKGDVLVDVRPFVVADVATVKGTATRPGHVFAYDARHVGLVFRADRDVVLDVPTFHQEAAS